MCLPFPLQEYKTCCVWPCHISHHNITLWKYWLLTYLSYNNFFLIIIDAHIYTMYSATHIMSRSQSRTTNFKYVRYFIYTYFIFIFYLYKLVSWQKLINRSVWTVQHRVRLWLKSLKSWYYYIIIIYVCM